MGTIICWGRIWGFGFGVSQFIKLGVPLKGVILGESRGYVEDIIKGFGA